MIIVKERTTTIHLTVREAKEAIAEYCTRISKQAIPLNFHKPKPKKKARKTHRKVDSEQPKMKVLTGNLNWTEIQHNSGVDVIVHWHDGKENFDTASPDIQKTDICHTCGDSFEECDCDEDEEEDDDLREKLEPDD